MVGRIKIWWGTVYWGGILEVEREWANFRMVEGIWKCGSISPNKWFRKRDGKAKRDKKRWKAKIRCIYADPIVDLISIQLSDTAHCNINENLPFFFKTLVFDRLFLETTGVNVPFYSNIGRCLNFLEYALTWVIL